VLGLKGPRNFAFANGAQSIKKSMMVGRAVERRGLLIGDGFLASFCGAQLCGELLEGGFSIGFRRAIAWITLLL
jgi:hypothetical protein